MIYKIFLLFIMIFIFKNVFVFWFFSFYLYFFLDFFRVYFFKSFAVPLFLLYLFYYFFLKSFKLLPVNTNNIISNKVNSCLVPLSKKSYLPSLIHRGGIVVFKFIILIPIHRNFVVTLDMYFGKILICEIRDYLFKLNCLSLFLSFEERLDALKYCKNFSFSNCFNFLMLFKLGLIRTSSFMLTEIEFKLVIGRFINFIYILEFNYLEFGVIYSLEEFENFFCDENFSCFDGIRGSEHYCHKKGRLLTSSVYGLNCFIKLFLSFFSVANQSSESRVFYFCNNRKELFFCLNEFKYQYKLNVCSKFFYENQGKGILSNLYCTNNFFSYEDIRESCLILYHGLNSNRRYVVGTISQSGVYLSLYNFIFLDILTLTRAFYGFYLSYFVSTSGKARRDADSSFLGAVGEIMVCVSGSLLLTPTFKVYNSFVLPVSSAVLTHQETNLKGFRIRYSQKDYEEVIVKECDYFVNWEVNCRPHTQLDLFLNRTLGTEGLFCFSQKTKYTIVFNSRLPEIENTIAYSSGLLGKCVTSTSKDKFKRFDYSFSIEIPIAYRLNFYSYLCPTLCFFKGSLRKVYGDVGLYYCTGGYRVMKDPDLNSKYGRCFCQCNYDLRPEIGEDVLRYDYGCMGSFLNKKYYLDKFGNIQRLQYPYILRPLPGSSDKDVHYSVVTRNGAKCYLEVLSEFDVYFKNWIEAVDETSYRSFIVYRNKITNLKKVKEQIEEQELDIDIDLVVKSIKLYLKINYDTLEEAEAICSFLSSETNDLLKFGVEERQVVETKNSCLKRRSLIVQYFGGELAFKRICMFNIWHLPLWDSLYEDRARYAVHKTLSAYFALELYNSINHHHRIRKTDEEEELFIRCPGLSTPEGLVSEDVKVKFSVPRITFTEPYLRGLRYRMLFCIENLKDVNLGTPEETSLKVNLVVDSMKKLDDDYIGIRVLTSPDRERYEQIVKSFIMRTLSALIKFYYLSHVGIHELEFTAIESIHFCCHLVRLFCQSPSPSATLTHPSIRKRFLLRPKYSYDFMNIPRHNVHMLTPIGERFSIFKSQFSKYIARRNTFQIYGRKACKAFRQLEWVANAKVYKSNMILDGFYSDTYKSMLKWARRLGELEEMFHAKEIFDFRKVRDKVQRKYERTKEKIRIMVERNSNSLPILELKEILANRDPVFESWDKSGFKFIKESLVKHFVFKSRSEYLEFCILKRKLFKKILEAKVLRLKKLKKEKDFK